MVAGLEFRWRDGPAVLAPLLTTFTAVLVGTMPLGIPFVGPVMPPLCLMTVFFWTIHRPQQFPRVATFGFGLVADALGGQAFGSTALILVVVQLLVSSQRRFFVGKHFALTWWGFLLVAPAAAMVAWFLNAAVHGAFVPLGPVLVQLVLTLVLFPPVAWVLGLIDQALPRPV
ncbi:MAG: rod shape-determining protein MreD [Alphaproteobacteria bacterium]|nr:rod shape-determining protein MreD [Alphaproteobacteria bacterium]